VLTRLLAEKLISDKDAETIRKGKSDARPAIGPTKWMYWNVHIDGLEYTHDLIVEREGVFKECVEAIRMAKILGYQVATNTTVYKETTPKKSSKCSSSSPPSKWTATPSRPATSTTPRKRTWSSGLNKQPEIFFLTRKMTREKFAKSRNGASVSLFFGTPIYQEFLAGKRELTCSAWAIPTRNIKGWKAPCYHDDRRSLPGVS